MIASYYLATRLLLDQLARTITNSPFDHTDSTAIRSMADRVDTITNDATYFASCEELELGFYARKTQGWTDALPVVPLPTRITMRAETWREARGILPRRLPSRRRL